MQSPINRGYLLLPAHLSHLPELISAERLLLHEDAPVAALGAVCVLLDGALDVQLGQTDGGPVCEGGGRQGW